MTARLFVLVDYDNLGGLLAGNSVDAVIRRIEAQIPNLYVSGVTHLEFRLYGGWVSGVTLTRLAQGISAKIQASFPATVQRLDNNGISVSRIISVSFARAGLFLPSEDLRDTFMRNRSIGSPRVDQGAWVSCAAPTSCPMGVVEKFINTKQCHVPSCGVTLGNLLCKDEQKQVDTLIVADMAELVFRQGVKKLVIVSSDADMWPGILLCLTAGASVCQMHTAPGGTTKANLKVNLSSLAASYAETSV